MKQRGRKSAVALATSSNAVEVVSAPPAPPLELTPEQCEVWKEIASSMPADWFDRATFALLKQYCRHEIESRRIAQLIDQEVSRAEDFDPERYDKLLSMQKRESDVLSTLATKMRLAQQSRYGARGADSHKKRSNTSAAPPPWQ